VSRLGKIALLCSLVLNVGIVYVAMKALEYRAHINEYLYKYERVIDEFSGNDVWAEANLPLRSDTLVPGRVVFLGTQVTSYWDVRRSFPGWEAINRGVDHQFAAGLVLRFRQDVLALYPRAAVVEVSSYNFRPNTDRLEIQACVASIADLARFHGIYPVLTTAITPVTGTEVFEHPEYSIGDTVAAYNRWIHSYAEANGLRVAGFDEAVRDRAGGLDTLKASSKVDLNEAGYQAISQAVRAVIDSL